MSFHPHVHCIVPGGGLSADGRSFIRSRKKFFLPMKVLSIVFRGKLLALVKRAFVDQKLTWDQAADPVTAEEAFMDRISDLYAINWVVYGKKPFKSPFHVVQYLSRYTHKTAISNQRLASMDDQSVTFHYRDYKDDGKVKRMTLEAMEFLRRFRQHILPAGFQRIRYYGFLSNGHRQKKLQLCMRLTRTRARPTDKLTAKALILKLTGKDMSRCPCGGTWCRVSTLERDSS